MSVWGGLIQEGDHEMKPPLDWEQDDYSHILLEEEQQRIEEDRVAWHQYLMEGIAALVVLAFVWLVIAVTFTF